MTTSDPHLQTQGPLVLEHDDVLSMQRTWRNAAVAVDTDEISSRMDSIHSDLMAGDIDAAYDTFTNWIRQEARYAKAERTTNMVELVKTMLEMIDWMHERVPRSIVKAAAQASR